MCYWCTHGWPKEIQAIYDEALKKLDGYEYPLHFGPAHIVWDDCNWMSAQECLDDFHYNREFISDDEAEIVRESLRKLAALPDSIKMEPNTSS